MNTDKKTKGNYRRFGTRRDMCYFVGRRASMLKPSAAAAAWEVMARRVEEMGEMDIPKFLDLLAAIRGSTITGFSTTRRLRLVGLLTEEGTEG